MRQRLETVRPDEGYEVHHRVLTPEAGDAEREMFDDRTRHPSAYEVAVRERVLELGEDRVDVAHGLPLDIFKDERERLQLAGPDVELGCAVFVEDRRDTGEG